jgi:hypothetical protein
MKTRMMVLAVLAGASTLLAVDRTWDGEGGDGLWGTAANWSGDTVPGLADRAIITTNGFATAVKRIVLGDHRSINELRFNTSTIGADNVILDGEETYRLTLNNGTISGPGWGTPKITSAVACELVLGASGTWTLPENWQSSLSLYGRVTDGDNGYNVVFGGNQNMYFVIGGPWDIKGALSIQGAGARIGGTYTNALDEAFYGGSVTNAVGVYLDGRLGSTDQSETALTLENLYQADSDRIRGATTLGTKRTGGALILNGNADDAVAERVSTLDLQSGRLSLTVAGRAASVGTDLIFDTVQRASGTALQVTTNTGGRLIVEGATNTNGTWQPWCFFGPNYSKVGPANTLSSTFTADYLTPAATGSDPTKLYRLTEVSLALEEDSSMWGLKWDSSSAQTLDLGPYDLTIGSGAMIVYGNSNKRITASGGRLVFGGEDVVYYVEGSASFTNSAPVAWEKPGGSAVTCPSLVFARGNRTDGITLDGEDRIGTYSNLYCYAYYSSTRRTLTFAGPSDRTFNGTVNGVFNIDKRGSGTLTFAGPNERRSGGFSVYEGRAVLAHATAPAPTVYEGAACEIAESVAYNSRPVLQPGGTLAGSGTLLQSMGTAQLLSGARLAPGTVGQAACFTFNSTVALAGDADFDIKIDTATNDSVRVVNTFTLPPSGSTFTFRLSDLSNGTAPINGRDFVVVRWVGSLANSGNTINTVVENASPATLDTTDAVVTLNESARTITISGVRAVTKGTLIMAL